MKLLHTITLVTLLTSPFALFANDNKVIYGPDNRMEVNDAPTQYAQWAKSTAGMIAASNITADGENMVIKGRTLEQMGVCATENFADQPTMASCSGFLVAEDKLVTAGHCITDENDCSKNAWVFDYTEDKIGEDRTVFKTSKKNVFRCKKIISRSQSMLTKNDYALIQLDRPTGRPALKVHKHKVKKGSQLVIIGHPTGLPTKIADGASVRKKKWKYFQANLDSFGGNSGSAVVNAKTGEVEGILVRGDRDYRYDSAQGCTVVNTCPDTGCRGEDVTYIKNVRKLPRK